MAAMKPRTTGGEMEAVEESRKIVMRIPSDGGGRIVIELSKEEAAQLGSLLVEVSSCLLYTSPSPRDRQKSRMPSSA